MRPVDQSLATIPPEDMLGIGQWITTQAHSHWPLFSLWLGETLTSEVRRRGECPDQPAKPYVTMPQLSDQQLRDFVQGALAFAHCEGMTATTGWLADRIVIVAVGELSSRLMAYSRAASRARLESN